MIQSHLDTMLVYLMMLMLQGDDPNRVTTDSNNLESSTYQSTWNLVEHMLYEGQVHLKWYMKKMIERLI